MKHVLSIQLKQSKKTTGNVRNQPKKLVLAGRCDACCPTATYEVSVAVVLHALYEHMYLQEEVSDLWQQAAASY